MDNKVSIVILNWNEPKITIRCIESCINLNYDNFDIIIVDNASIDDSVNILKSKFPGITLIQNNNNMGYAGGNNIGIDYALTNNSDYIWILNNDVIVEQNSLSYLMEFFKKNNDAYAVSPKVLEFPNMNIISYGGGFIDQNKFMSVNIGEGEEDAGQYDTTQEVSFMSGCSILINRNAIKKIGAFPEDYFLYFEETEWCMNVAKNEGKMYYVPNAIVYHERSATTKKKKGTTGYYFARNKLFFMERNFDERNLFKFLSISFFDALSALNKFNLRLAYNITIAFLDWFLGNMGPIYSPRKIGLAIKRLNQ